MKTWIAPALIILALTGCSTGSEMPGRTVADSSCESGQRLMKIGARISSFRMRGPRWVEGECLPVEQAGKERK